METLSFYLLTWNVVTLQPPAAEQLLKIANKESDFIAIGLQEVKSQPQNILADNLYEDPWTNAWRDSLAEHNYVKVHTIRLVGIILSLFAKRKHLTSIRNIETSYTRTGLGGLWGNKGAVTLRFNYKGSSFCVVNCHLTPHDDMLAYRIGDYHSIINSQTFQKDKIRSILDHDLVFWIGDLNFRLDTKSNLTAKSIAELVSKDELNLLLDRDELTQTISRNEAFNDFSECRISFKPTYKFIPNSQQYDLKRKPAWTDRILFRTFDEEKQINDRLACLDYASHPEMDMSDHKPVSAHFRLQVKGGVMPSVDFEPIKSWTIGETASISYKLPSNIPPSAWHWIAFYRAGFSSFGEYISYVWASSQKIPGRPGAYQVTVPSNTIRFPGKYQAVYLSDTAPYEMLGVSQIFEVQGF